MLTKTQKEDLRHAVREFLALRVKLAFNVEQMHKMMARHPTLDFAPEVADIEEAAVYLYRLGQVRELSADDLSSVSAWQITVAGSQAHERGF